MPVLNQGILGSKHMSMMPTLGSDLWTPAQLSSVQMLQWIDATDEFTVTLNGSTVAQINDKSGNSNDMSQGVSTNQPTYDTSGSINRLVCDSNDFLSVNSPVFPDAVDLYIVMNPTNTGRIMPFVYVDPSNLNYPISGDNGSTSTIVSYRVGNSVTYKNNGNSIVLNTRGEAYNQMVEGAIGITNIGNVNPNVGVLNEFRLSGYGSTWNVVGDIYEVIKVPSDLDFIEKLKIEGYLAHKYNLEASLPLGHPYRTNPPMKTQPQYSPMLSGASVVLDFQDENSITLNGLDIGGVENQISNLYGGFEQTNAVQQPLYNTSDSNAGGFKTMDTNDGVSTKQGLEAQDSITFGDFYFVMTYKDGSDSTFDSYSNLISDPVTTANRIIGDTGTADLYTINTFTNDLEVNGSVATNTVLPMPFSVVRASSITAGTGVLDLFFVESAGTRDWEGSLAYMAIFPEKLDTENSDKVVGYLSHEFNLTSDLPLGHPYKSTRPTLSDPTWTPWQLNPLLWLDISESGSITLNGSDVSNIQGVARNGDNFAQGIASDQPVYNSADGAIEFDGTHNLESTNKELFNTLHEQSGSITMKIKLNDANSGELMPLFSTASNTGSSKGVFISVDDRSIVGTNRLSFGLSNGSGGSGAFAYLTRSSSDFSLGDSDVTDEFIIHIEWDSTSCAAYKNNVLLGTQNILTTLGTGDSSLNPIFGEAGADNFNGDVVKGVVITDGKLTSDERTNLYNYLNS